MDVVEGSKLYLFALDIKGKSAPSMEINAGVVVSTAKGSFFLLGMCLVNPDKAPYQG